MPHKRAVQTAAVPYRIQGRARRHALERQRKARIGEESPERDRRGPLKLDWNDFDALMFGGLHEVCMPMKTSRGAQLLAAAAVAVLAACDLSAPAVSHEKDSRPQAVVQTQDVKQRQISFLNRIREADPQARTIDRALMNEQNELGVVLDRTVEMDKIPALMKTLLTKMAQEFPGEDLTVLAYTPSNPPRKIGTARLNAQTRDMTYTPEK